MVYVIIVSYNGMKWMEECLNSVLNSSVPVSVIVIDNHSTDGTAGFIKTNFPEVLLVEQKENLGFGKANNIGMSYALNQNADFVFLLNQDAFVDEKTIENLAAISKDSHEYGILSPVQLDYTGKLLEIYFFRFMANDVSRTFYSDFVLKKEPKKVYDIDFIQAAAWLLPINTIKKIGGFDPLFFHYGEDDNYCQRVLFHDLKIGVVPDVFIRHDSEKQVVEDFKLFSERDLNDYKKNICVKYANINKPFIAEMIAEEKKRIYRVLFLSFLQLNFVKGKGFVKRLKIVNQSAKLINNSRNVNVQINANYLDVN
jgi:GT2 family glycosyltransferase